MIKLAIAVKSCHRDLDAGHHDTIRGTWGKDAKALGIDVFFFMGHDPTQEDTRRSRRYQPGEIVLNCKDDYMSLPDKTRKICQWVNGKLITHVFLCDNDTLVNPTSISSTGWSELDYAGYFHNHVPGEAPFHYRDDYGDYPECRAWASGGAGYLLSRKAADVVASSYPNMWAEDLWVGQVLAPLIDKKELKARAFLKGFLGEHFIKSPLFPAYDPKVMQMAYENGGFRALFEKGILVA